MFYHLLEIRNFMFSQPVNNQNVNQLVNCQILRNGRVGLVVKALAFHQCGPGSISAPGVIRGLSLLVLYSAMRGFPPGTPVFPSHQKPTFDLICRKTVVN